MGNFDNNNQLRQLKKVFLAPFLFLISTLLIFISYKLIKSEYDEYFVFGGVQNGLVSNIFWDNSSSESPPSNEFHCEINIDKNKFDYKIQNANQSFAISQEERLLIENVSIGDSVIVKILNEKQVKVLEWKKTLINKKNDFSSILWLWILIFALTIISIIIFIKIYKIYK
jgi:hypothetical protein